jgi:porphobilinogen synthase
MAVFENYPWVRLRRFRQTEGMRQIFSENHLRAEDLVAPLFLIEGENRLEPIESMPGCYRMTIDLAVEETRLLYKLGIRMVLLFAHVPPEKRDNTGQEALNPDGLMQQSIRSLKAAVPEMLVASDIALDPYSTYGHDGIVDNGKIENDYTVAVLARMALSHAIAGADIVAPSDMMDGRVSAIRSILEVHQVGDRAILSYAAKFASCFYGPFRDALDSKPGFGDKKSYQLNPANLQEALREVELDVKEGADIIMIKPGMPYLDIVRAVADRIHLPIAVYQVSGEYAMIQAAAEKGWINRESAIYESLIAFKRAGATLIVTYFAKTAAILLADRRF